MDAAARAVAFDAAVDRRAGKILAARRFHDSLVQGLALPPVVLSEMHPNHLRCACKLHDVATRGRGGSTQWGDLTRVTCGGRCTASAVISYGRGSVARSLTRRHAIHSIL